MSRLIPAALILIGVVACAPLPQTTQQAPQVAAPAAVRIIATFGPDDGYQMQDVKIPIGADVCDRLAFVDGFKRDYFFGWNQFVGPKESTYGYMLLATPRDQRVIWNSKLYKNKKFNLKGFDEKNHLYGPQRQNSPDSIVRCSVGSYEQGKRAGTAAAYKDFRVIEVQEIPSK